MLDKEIGLFSAERQAEFVPYWDNGDLVSFAVAEKDGYRKAAPKGGYASLYRQPGKALVEVVLHEGRKHVVRRMLEVAGHPVTRLVRTQIGTLRLGDLRTGRTRVLNRTELGELMDLVEL